MNPQTSIPLAALVIALATPACALAVDSSQTPGDQKATLKRNNSTGSAAQSTSKKPDPIVFEGVRLLTPEEELQGNISVSDLANLIVNVETQTRKVFAANKQPGSVLLSFTSTPAAQTVNIAFQPRPNEQPPQELLQQLMNAVSSLNKLKVKSGTVQFLVQFTLNP